MFGFNVFNFITELVSEYGAESPRIIGEEKQDEPDTFMKECVERFDNEFEFLIYFGVTKNFVGHPAKPNISKNIRYGITYILYIYINI